MAKKKELLATTTKAITRLELFGPPLLFEGEDFAAYDEFLARVSGDVKPTNIIEEILVHDVVNLTWEIHRWRRFKISLLAAHMLNDLEIFVDPFVRRKSTTNEVPSPERKIANKLVKKWAARDPAAVKRIDRILASADITLDTIMARVFLARFDTIDRIDRSIMTTEARRNAVLREIDRHRTTLAQTLRHTLQEAEEAEFEVVEPKNAVSKDSGQKNAA